MANRALDLAVPGIARALARLPELRIVWPEISITPRGSDHSEPMIAIRTGMAVNISCRSEWVDEIGRLARVLHPDLLFSPVGCYDLSRITLAVPANDAPPQGTGIWGPIPSYVADASMWKPMNDDRPVHVPPRELRSVDRSIFWHCAGEHALAAFGIYDGGELQALATVEDLGGGDWEIGVDVVPHAQGRRLGSAVVSAAGNWVLEHGGLIYATAASWNVPSSRNLRSLGMEYACSGLVGLPAPFQQPPQPLGTPLPGVEMVNRYPRWAMNQDISDRDR